MFVRSLPGKLGVKTKRYCDCGCVGAEMYRHNNEKLIRDLEGIQDRRAEYRTVLTYVDSDTAFVVKGVSKGHISKDIQGTNGCAYDKVMAVEGGCTVAELNEEFKKYLE